MQVDELGQFADRLVHENTAAVGGRVDGVGRNEQDREAFGRRRQRLEAIAIVAGVVALECFFVVDEGL